MSEVPSLKEEVERKAIETMEKIVSDRARGAINEAQYSYAVDVLWSLFAGVAGSEFMFIVEQMESQKKPNAATVQSTHIKGDKVAVVRNHYNGIVSVKIVVPSAKVQSKVFDFRDSDQPLSEAKKKQEAILDSMFENDFIEI